MGLNDLFLSIFNPKKFEERQAKLAIKYLFDVTRNTQPRKIPIEISHVIRVWDGEKLLGWGPGLGKSFLEYALHMESTIINSKNGGTQVFEGDIVSYNNDIYVVTHDPFYLDYPDGSEWGIRSIDKNSAFDLRNDWPPVNIVGNIFSGPYKIKIRKFLRIYKTQIIDSIPPMQGVPELESPYTSSLRRSNYEKLDGFRVDSLDGYFAERLNRRGMLNTGVCCPLCGLTPLSNSPDWPFQRKWTNGVHLNICEQCFSEKNVGLK